MHAQGSWLPDPLFSVKTRYIHRCKHGSDSEVYDTEGRYIPVMLPQDVGGGRGVQRNVHAHAHCCFLPGVAWAAGGQQKGWTALSEMCLAAG